MPLCYSSCIIHEYCIINNNCLAEEGMSKVHSLVMSKPKSQIYFVPHPLQSKKAEIIAYKFSNSSSKLQVAYKQRYNKIKIYLVPSHYNKFMSLSCSCPFVPYQRWSCCVFAIVCSGKPFTYVRSAIMLYIIW